MSNDSTPIEATCNFCPRCGKKVDTVGELPFRCQACQFTLFFGPVAAVGGLLLNAQQQLFLLRRASEPGKGLWGLPGGFVDRGESIEEALLREIREEVGLEVSTAQYLVSFPNRYNYRGVVAPVVDLFYVCQAKEDIEVEMAVDEVSEYVWCDPSAYLSDLAFESNRKAIEFWMRQVKGS